MRMKTLPIFLVFLCMGFGDAVGPFVGLAKETFQLSNTMAQLIPFTGFLMFGLLSVPMGVFQDKHGKKNVLLTGVLIMLIGLLIPTIFGFSYYALFLVTILLLGAGATILQVAGNPIMRDVSAEGKYSRNLSLAQFVKAIGSLSGPLIPAGAAYFYSRDWRVIFPVYSIALMLTLLLIAFMRIHEKEVKEKTASFKSCLSLLKDKFVLMMVLGIFLYVGSEVSMSSGVPIYLESEFGVDISTLGVLGAGLFFLTLTIGRFAGGIILNWMKPANFLMLTVVLAVIGIIGLFFGVQTIAIISVILIGLSFANIFPLIFSITVDRMPERSNELSGLMVTAIVGGAVLPLLMGVLADLTNSLIGFLVPLAAMLYITTIALSVKRTNNT
ncbi:MAG: MFS transporter [candidate division KSB1 bacterium]|nr:MFS transporter [candidate division KSB1 bacterium]